MTVTVVPGKLNQAKCRSIGNQHSSFAPKKSSSLALALLYLADENQESKHYTTKSAPDVSRLVRLIKRPKEVEQCREFQMVICKRKRYNQLDLMSRKFGCIYTCNVGSSAHAEAALTAILHI